MTGDGERAPPAGPLRHLERALAELDGAGLLRAPPPPDPPGALVLCSNDYLGYAAEPLAEGLAEAGGAGASRLVVGEDLAHAACERELAAWVGAPAALLFSCGYAANVGALAALAGPGDVIVSDALNHASIIDGCRLSEATVQVFPHLDGPAMESLLSGARSARRRWVVTESYFSMDGDSPDLLRYREACDRHDAALFVDEAHALGVFGARGAGLCAAAGVQPDVLVGTLGKALGLQGAFVAGQPSLRAWLWNRARSFVFSTGISPALAAAATRRVRRAAADDAGRARLHASALSVRGTLASLGRSPAAGSGPIIPWLVGSADVAVEQSARLRSRGVLVQAIRPPTVPRGTSRLRITVRANLSPAQLERALEAFTAVLA